MTFWSECIALRTRRIRLIAGVRTRWSYKSNSGTRCKKASVLASVQRSKGSTISVISAHPLRSLDPLRFEHSPSFLAFWAQKCFPRRCARPSSPHLGSAFYKKQGSQASYFPLCCCPMPHPRSPKRPFIEEVRPEWEGVVPKADSA